MPLIDIPPATVVHNVEMRPGNGAVLARSAGTSVQIMSHDQDYTTLKLASGEVRRVQVYVKQRLALYQILIKKISKLVKLEEADG